jgi:hypothetical protein
MAIGQPRTWFAKALSLIGLAIIVSANLSVVSAKANSIRTTQPTIDHGSFSVQMVDAEGRVMENVAFQFIGSPKGLITKRTNRSGELSIPLKRFQKAENINVTVNDIDWNGWLLADNNFYIRPSKNEIVRFEVGYKLLKFRVQFQDETGKPVKGNIEARLLDRRNRNLTKLPVGVVRKNEKGSPYWEVFVSGRPSDQLDLNVSVDTEKYSLPGKATGRLKLKSLKAFADSGRQLVLKVASITKLSNDPAKTARNKIKREEKAEVERKKHLAKADRKAEQERVRKADADHQRRVATERKRKLAEARSKILAPLRRKNKHSVAVIIGNKNYEGSTPAVDFAHNDADAMRKFVLERLAYRDGNIIDLRDARRNEIEAVFGNERTHEGELFNFIREGKSDVIVYYSGHGVPGLKDKLPYLLPVDVRPNFAEVNGYPIATLYKNLERLPARSVTIFLDACFSGDSEKGMLISSASGLGLEPELPSTGDRLTVITAAQGNQLASWDPKARHGLFTKHLLDALNGKADNEEYGNTDGKADGKVTLSEVQMYLDDEMTYQARRTWNRRQNAYVRGSGNLVLASVFSLPGSVSDTADIEEMDATYTALKAANLRAGPSTDTAVVGKLKVNTSVNVTGKVSGRNWYRLYDGSFVFGSLIRVSE